MCLLLRIEDITAVKPCASVCGRSLAYVQHKLLNCTYWHIPGTVCNRISIAWYWITCASFFLVAIFLCEMCFRFFAIQYFLLLFFFCTSKSSDNNKPTQWGVHLFTCTRAAYVCLSVCVCEIKMLNATICYSIPYTNVRLCCMQRVYEYNVTNMHRLIVLQGVS